MFRVSTRLSFIEPQLATAVDEPPQGKQWIHEIKHDGYRCQVLLERGQARVFTRNGYDWTDRYRSIARAASSLRCQSAIIDGEAIDCSVGVGGVFETEHFLAVLSNMT